MIDGLKIDVTAEELEGHLRERSEYHAGRSVAYKSQAVGVQEIQEEDGGPASYSNSPSRSLSESAENHRKKSAYYLFLADHIVRGETYRLTERDLGEIGITSPRW